MPKTHSQPPESLSPDSKLERLLMATRARSGASMEDLTAVTGWQPHSVRAALSRLRARGHAIHPTQTKSGTRYRLRKAQ